MGWGEYRSSNHSQLCREGWPENEKVAYWLVVVGHPRVLRHTTLYTFIMVDNEGVGHEVQAYGIDKITEDSVIQDLSGVKTVFPGAPA